MKDIHIIHILEEIENNLSLCKEKEVLTISQDTLRIKIIIKVNKIRKIIYQWEI